MSITYRITNVKTQEVFEFEIHAIMNYPISKLHKLGMYIARDRGYICPDDTVKVEVKLNEEHMVVPL